MGGSQKKEEEEAKKKKRKTTFRARNTESFTERQKEELQNRKRKASGAESLCCVLFVVPTPKGPRSHTRFGGRV